MNSCPQQQCGKVDNSAGIACGKTSCGKTSPKRRRKAKGFQQAINRAEDDAAGLSGLFNKIHTP